MGGIGISKIKTNPVVDKLRSGQPSVGAWLSLCSPVAAEAMAHIGWDWLVVDAEHSHVGFDTMVNCFRAIQLGGAVPMARVPWNDTVWIRTESTRFCASTSQADRHDPSNAAR